MSERDAGQLFTVAKALLRPVFGFFWRLRVVGLENIPVNGPAILSPNHISVIDSFFLPAVLPRRITYVGKAEYMDDWKTRWLFPALGMIPIDRSGGSASERALSAATRILDKGELFGIYPEGTRSRDGKLHKGRTGVARLALQTGSPIIPVGFRGTDEIQPPDQPIPRPFMTAEIRIGQPIDVGRYQVRLNGDPLVYRQLTDELMFEISTLSGQEYVHEYAGQSEVDVGESRSSAEVLSR